MNRCKVFFSFLLLTALLSSTVRASAPLPNNQVTQLQTDPQSLLARFPSGGPAMAQYVSQAILSDVSLIDTIFSVAEKATPQQASAIGAGMARGARILGVKHPKMVRVITEKVLKLHNRHLKVTYLAIGPTYDPNMALVIPDPIPPFPLLYSDVGSPLGVDRSRIGPLRNDQLIATLENESFTKILVQTPDGEILARNAPLIAIIASDAAHNGVVSTSPTQ